MTAVPGPPLLSLATITKTFPGVRALDEVSLEVQAGECHALVGENGAGKSTLLKILGGVIPSGEFEGELRIDGVVRRFTGVSDAEDAGIAVVHQELSLVGPLSVAANIALGHEPRTGGIIDRRRLRARAVEVLASLHVSLDPDAAVERLGVGPTRTCCSRCSIACGGGASRSSTSRTASARCCG